MKKWRSITLTGLSFSIMGLVHADEPGSYRELSAASTPSPEAMGGTSVVHPSPQHWPVAPPPIPSQVPAPNAIPSRQADQAPPPVIPGPEEGFPGLEPTPLPGSKAVEAERAPRAVAPVEPEPVPEAIPPVEREPVPTEPEPTPPAPAPMEPEPEPEPAPTQTPQVEPAPTPVEPEPGVTDIPPPSIPEPGSEVTDIPPPSIPPAAPGAAAPTTPTAPMEPGAGALGEGTTLSALAAQGTFATPEVFGDSFGLSFLQVLPPTPQPPPPLPRPPIPPQPPSPFQPVPTVALVPSIRSLKIAENQSPAPRDRIIYTFNYFDSVNESINERFLAPISNIRIYRHIFGFEKTFFNQRTSFGMRLPLNTVTADSPRPDIGQTETALGDLNMFVKYAFYMDRERGRLFSTGLSITPTTGPDDFAGADYLEGLHNTTIQPFLGLIWSFDRFYVQGFTSIDVPFNPNDVTILYNDYAVGYFLHRSADPEALVSAVVPTFEVHVNTPLNHRGISLFDPAGSPDYVNLTYGTAFLFKQRARLLTGITTPVTGPRPFDFEVIAALNIYY